MAREQLKILGRDEVGQAIGRGAQIEQAAALCLGDPCIVVSVAVKDYPLVLADNAADKIVQCGGKVGSAFKLIGIKCGAIRRPWC